MDINSVLADILDRGAASTEWEVLLAAVVDHGVYVPVAESGKVAFQQSEDDIPFLPGYVSAACLAEQVAEPVAPFHCDALRLWDIAERTGVPALVLHSDRGRAALPMGLVIQVLHERGWRGGEGKDMRLTWSTHPVAVALRDALRRRIREFPTVRSVWVSHARWVDTGFEQLMLHVAVDERLPSDTPRRLLDTLLAEEVTVAGGDPKLAVLPLDTTVHAETIAELDRMALDTVRHDPATGRIEVLSREFDDPRAAEAARQAAAAERAAAPGEGQERPRRWWQRP
ncbi:hypothetical protein [Kitasatospora sp. DSM 101779]|uniref:hypothetical protein n=1 Tax=Kitasatospora sp. DSM 101779 TaxID=2853165 RepID=UPI0021D9985D|nr:hypothetical protein [Kitasatospora sp. DSM 101779]MCU7826675.1 hypothetical protein [Kitasatospora sp. DSM 101779]